MALKLTDNALVYGNKDKMDVAVLNKTDDFAIYAYYGDDEVQCDLGTMDNEEIDGGVIEMENEFRDITVGELLELFDKQECDLENITLVWGESAETRREEYQEALDAEFERKKQAFNAAR